MKREPEQRYCARCGSRLNRYNAETLCGPCNLTARDQVLHPPTVPPGFWQTDKIRDALATWHMGRVIFAYRTPSVPRPTTAAGASCQLAGTDPSAAEPDREGYGTRTDFQADSLGRNPRHSG